MAEAATKFLVVTLRAQIKKLTQRVDVAQVRQLAHLALLARLLKLANVSSEMESWTFTPRLPRAH